MTQILMKTHRRRRAQWIKQRLYGDAKQLFQPLTGCSDHINTADLG